MFSWSCMSLKTLQVELFINRLCIWCSHVKPGTPDRADEGVQAKPAHSAVLQRGLEFQ